MSRLGLVPDFYFNVPLQALSTPRDQLGLVMVDTNPLGCQGPAGTAVATPLGRVMVDDSPLGAIDVGSVVSTIAMLGGLFAAGVGTVKLYRYARPRVRRFFRR